MKIPFDISDISLKIIQDDLAELTSIIRSKLLNLSALSLTIAQDLIKFSGVDLFHPKLHLLREDCVKLEGDASIGDDWLKGRDPSGWLADKIWEVSVEIDKKRCSVLMGLSRLPEALKEWRRSMKIIEFRYGESSIRMGNAHLNCAVISLLCDNLDLAENSLDIVEQIYVANRYPSALLFQLRRQLKNIRQLGTKEKFESKQRALLLGIKSHYENQFTNVVNDNQTPRDEKDLNGENLLKMIENEAKENAKLAKKRGSDPSSHLIDLDFPTRKVADLKSENGRWNDNMLTYDENGNLVFMDEATLEFADFPTELNQQSLMELLKPDAPKELNEAFDPVLPNVVIPEVILNFREFKTKPKNRKKLSKGITTDARHVDASPVRLIAAKLVENSGLSPQIIPQPPLSAGAMKKQKQTELRRLEKEKLTAANVSLKNSDSFDRKTDVQVLTEHVLVIGKDDKVEEREKNIKLPAQSPKSEACLKSDKSAKTRQRESCAAVELLNDSQCDSKCKKMLHGAILSGESKRTVDLVKNGVLSVIEHGKKLMKKKEMQEVAPEKLEERDKHVNQALVTNIPDPLYLAAFVGRGMIVSSLLDDGLHPLNYTAVDSDEWCPSLPNSFSDTPLHCAAAKGHAHCLNHLINALTSCGDVEILDGKGRTPLWRAAAGLQADSVRILLDANAKATAKQVDTGHSILHAVLFVYFLKKAHSKARGSEVSVKVVSIVRRIVLMLLECGARPLSRNSNGHSSIDLATRPLGEVCDEHLRAGIIFDLHSLGQSDFNMDQLRLDDEWLVNVFTRVVSLGYAQAIGVVNDEKINQFSPKVAELSDESDQNESLAEFHKDLGSYINGVSSECEKQFGDKPYWNRNEFLGMAIECISKQVKITSEQSKILFDMGLPEKGEIFMRLELLIEKINGEDVDSSTEVSVDWWDTIREFLEDEQKRLKELELLGSDTWR
eukprot:GDKJ01044795.1.p1 GENE.GDKJ01044795.1~~GDKJ01044795.1.p1  ORF type:complete len:990 (-),score=199.87 GDKJ01044795.1:71-2923(-)